MKTKCPGCKRESCQGCAFDGQLHTNKQAIFTLPRGFAIEPGSGFGIAYDMGTTTLAAYLWDLSTGDFLGAVTETNPQRAYGIEIVSRMDRALQGEEACRKMQYILMVCMDQMAEKLAILPGGEMREIKQAVAVGNTYLCQSLLGISPEKLAKAPFEADYKKAVCCKGEELGFCFLKNTVMQIMPPVGGYVGADALCAYGCADFERDGAAALVVDIGTNGELIYMDETQGIACSVAAGPALEGGAVAFGMRAVPGAIDRVVLAGRFPNVDIMIGVIGAKAPIGICGSGLLMALQTLLSCGIIDESGYMLSRKEALNKGISFRLCGRIEETPKGRGVLLYGKDEPIYLYSTDVRELQLAISALRSGAEYLLNLVGKKVKEIDKIYLTGAFGSSIPGESILACGILPRISEEKLIFAGNMAGIGASMALLSPSFYRRLEEAAKEIEAVSLAEEPEFRELFIKNMNFPLIS